MMKKFKEKIATIWGDMKEIIMILIEPIVALLKLLLGFTIFTLVIIGLICVIKFYINH